MMKNPNVKTRVVHSRTEIKARFVTTIIEDCRSLYGTPLNGYWKIPSQFISQII